jgi:phenylacetate-CoA ligase
LIHGEYFTHLFYGVKGVVKFQFIQETLERFKLYIVPGKEFELAVLGGLKEKILKAVGQDCSLITEFVDDIPPTRSGKFLFTVSQLSVSFIAAQKASGDARVQKKDKQL